ncbi:DUF1156 domain-containing protein [Meiothermus granaticius]|uniref:DUF1156 domain-containing protein n=1 Tax=Meiothermus granaticius TaxID=863370 RepID=UPI00118F3123|nr:DUF1156 domain-containing protein [Meiothermus granaticius]GEM88445.1 hypothetical protein MGR01S_30700 [Meiothermus granaticius NBRC 107808]
MPKKLIEVALPLEAINRESAREKSIRHGHPSTLHLWWARRPLAAARAVLFASLVDDPSAHPERFPTPQAQEAERKRLFELIERLVKWENSTNPQVLSEARQEILNATGGNPPPVLDPFAGGGTIPLEAQRLGLEAHASDLNPVAVLINKALIEIPPRFAGQPPINPAYRQKARPSDRWPGAKGLAEDVRYYGQWMRDEAERRIGHLYPRAQLPSGSQATVIAWLWARTVRCPNPACGCQMPLVRSWVLSSKPGKEHHVEPQIDRSTQPPRVRYAIKRGKNAPEPPKTARGANFKCIACNQPVPGSYIKAEGVAGRMGAQMMAIVAEGNRERVYLPPTKEQEEKAQEANPKWYPEGQISDDRRSMFTPLYGLTHFHHLFTPRQLEALTTFSDLVAEAREKALQDAQAAGLGEQAKAYADAVAVYLGLGVSRLADIQNSLCMWESSKTQVRHLFTKQAIPMLWDYSEAGLFSKSAGDFIVSLGSLLRVLEAMPSSSLGKAYQQDATKINIEGKLPLISTDPPYYDNIGYADLSDFFYVWLRRSLGGVLPELFGTLLVPKAAELVATPYRFEGSKPKAQAFFEEGLGKAFERMREAAHPDYPLTVYYAFKQAESEEADGPDDEQAEAAEGRGNGGAEGTASTGWETMLTGLIRAGFQITGTWPMRSELSNRMVAKGANALASSIVLVCRPRPADAPVATRREFLQGLRAELPGALRELQQGSIAPVDLAQAAIGPGMAVYSRYAQVLESDGTPMRVRTALALINQMLDEVLSEQEGDFDPDTRWALAWFEQMGFEEGPFGMAETLSKAKNTSVQGLVEAGILWSRAGRVRLLRPEELPEGWNPAADPDIPVWEATHQLIRTLNTGGEKAAAALLAALPNGDAARELAYRLYAICERKKWAQEGLLYNALVTSWLEVSRLAQDVPKPEPTQEALL